MLTFDSILFLLKNITSISNIASLSFTKYILKFFQHYAHHALNTLYFYHATFDIIIIIRASTHLSVCAFFFFVISLKSIQYRVIKLLKNSIMKFCKFKLAFFMSNFYIFTQKKRSYSKKLSK